METITASVGNVRIGTKLGQICPKWGQIRDFFRTRSTNLSHFGSKSNHPGMSGLNRHDAWGHGEGFPHRQALLAVDEQGVVLDAQVLLQSGLGAE